MQRMLRSVCLALSLGLALPAAWAQGSANAPTREGVDVGRNSAFARLVPAEEVEASANKQ